MPHLTWCSSLAGSIRLIIKPQDSVRLNKNIKWGETLGTWDRVQRKFKFNYDRILELGQPLRYPFLLNPERFRD